MTIHNTLILFPVIIICGTIISGTIHAGAAILDPHHRHEHHVEPSALMLVSSGWIVSTSSA